MNGPIVIVGAVAIVSVCSIGFVLLLPALAGVTLRGNRAGIVRLVTLLAVLATLALIVSAVLGALPVAYSMLA